MNKQPQIIEWHVAGNDAAWPRLCARPARAPAIQDHASPEFRWNIATVPVFDPVFDFVSNSSFNVSVNLIWTATGLASRSNGHFHFQSPGCTVNGHSNGTSRPASAMGSVSDGATNFTPAPSSGASIGSFKSGDVTIGCGL